MLVRNREAALATARPGSGLQARHLPPGRRAADGPETHLGHGHPDREPLPPRGGLVLGRGRWPWRTRRAKAQDACTLRDSLR